MPRVSANRLKHVARVYGQEPAASVPFAGLLEMAGASTEGIGERIAHDMPIGGSETQVNAHRLSLDQLIGVVVFEGEGIFGFGTLVGDLRNAGEVFGAHGIF